MLRRGAVQPFTLRFLDDELEAAYQREEGADGLAGYRIITGATAIIWAIAAFVLPRGTDISSERAVTVGLTMAAVGTACFIAARWASTMNRQHGLATFLTSANGLVILALGASSAFLHGYAIAAILLLFLFGFVSRTRFVHAAVRTVVIGLGLAAAVATYAGDGSLLVDCFFYVVAGIASLVGLRLIERNRRRSWHQRLVIEEQAQHLEDERAESERLLLNVLPESVTYRLRNGETQIADDFPSVSVMFADIIGFTPLAATLSANTVISMLGELFSAYDDLVDDRGLEKIKTVGDSYMAVGGLPEAMPDHAQKVVDLALAIIDVTAASERFPDLAVRVGVHSGPVAGGVIGTRKFAYDIWGDTVNVASRLEEYGIRGRVHVSEQTRDLIVPMFEVEERGPIAMRGVGVVPTYLVVGAARAGDQPREFGATVDASDVVVVGDDHSRERV